MTYDPANPASMDNLTDQELMAHISRLADHPALATPLVCELLRRSLKRIVDATNEFKKANDARAEIAGQEAGRQFRVNVWLTVLSVLIAAAGFFLTVKINRDALRRQKDSEIIEHQILIDGIQWELGIAESECKKFNRSLAISIKRSTSPAWMAQTVFIQRGLGSDLFLGDAKSTSGLQGALYILTALNEHNRFLASPAVDALPLEAKNHLLKTNLTNYYETCHSMIKQVVETRAAVLARAKAAGLRYYPIDVNSDSPLDTPIIRAR